MTFDILNPRYSNVTRAFLSLSLIIITIVVSVFLSIYILDCFLNLSFFTDHIEITTLIVLIIPILFSSVAFKISTLFIYKSDSKGTLEINDKYFNITLNNSITVINNEDIKYVRFKNSMGWYVTSPYAYQIEIAQIGEEKTNLEYVQAKSQGQKLKYYIKSKGIKTRRWNL